MQSRGFRGEVHVLEDPAIQVSDWVYLAGFGAVAAAAIVMGR